MYSVFFKLIINGRCYLKQITEGVTTSSELKSYATFRGVKDSTFIKCLNLFIFILNYYQTLSVSQYKVMKQAYYSKNPRDNIYINNYKKHKHVS